MTKTPSLTHEEAIKKYFGDILHSIKYPFPCTCGQFWLMHLDEGWVKHLREKHGEKIISEKQRLRNEERARKKAEEEALKHSPKITYA